MSIAGRLPHYGRRSYVGFVGGRAQLMGMWDERTSPLRLDLAER
jgi:hypothetical protein